jgi:scyllo-inositol 2-dehydrogenase (NADP+)
MLPLRLGVIGAGRIWIRTHQPILSGMPDAFEIVALCDASAERRAALSTEYPQAAICDSAEALLQLEQVDAVLVLTPLALNAPTALAALEAGKHVIMEKPIARSSSEARHLIATAERMGCKLFITEQCGYTPLEPVLVDLLAKNAIGKPVLWERIQHWPGENNPTNPLSYGLSEWRKQADFPLGTLFDGGIHPIASLSSAFGCPETVYATGMSLRPQYGEYDQYTMTFRYANGMVGILSYSECMTMAKNHFTIHGSQAVMEAEYSEITISYLDKDAEPKIVPVPQEGGHERMWKQIARSFVEADVALYTPQMALRDVLILEAIDRSIKEGKVIAIESV